MEKTLIMFILCLGIINTHVKGEELDNENRSFIERGSSKASEGVEAAIDRMILSAESFCAPEVASQVSEESCRGFLGHFECLAKFTCSESSKYSCNRTDLGNGAFQLSCFTPDMNPTYIRLLSDAVMLEARLACPISGYTMLVDMVSRLAWGATLAHSKFKCN